MTSPGAAPMRKLVVYELLSLDGVAEAPETFFGWDESLDPNLADVIGSQDVVILGRTTYDEWSLLTGYRVTGKPVEPFPGAAS